MQVIERNARNVAKDDFDDRVRLIKADYRTAIDRCDRCDRCDRDAGGFDLVFLDPPYRMAEAYGDALARLLKAGGLKPGCLIVLERRETQTVELPEDFERYDIRHYGETAVEFVRLQPAMS